MQLSVIIVNYNTYELTLQTVKSVINTIGDDFDYEVIVVDNRSKDECIESMTKAFAFEGRVQLILNDENAGFSIANNIGIAASSGDYILTLNSDTIVQPGCLQKCLNYLQQHKDIGVLGCKLLLEDGTLDHACKRGFPSPEASLYYFTKLHKLFPESERFNQYTLGTQNIDEINEVDSLTGAFMLLPRKVIDEVGVFDEDFFMYGEDLDWCFRIKEAGYRVVYYPEATTIHLKGGSNGKKKRTKTIYEFHRAMILFYDKHYKKQYPAVIGWIMHGAVWGRFGVSWLVNQFRKK